MSFIQIGSIGKVNHFIFVCNFFSYLNNADCYENSIRKSIFLVVIVHHMLVQAEHFSIEKFLDASITFCFPLVCVC